MPHISTLRPFQKKKRQIIVLTLSPNSFFESKNEKKRKRENNTTSTLAREVQKITGPPPHTHTQMTHLWKNSNLRPSARKPETTQGSNVDDSSCINKLWISSTRLPSINTHTMQYRCFNHNNQLGKKYYKLTI